MADDDELVGDEGVDEANLPGRENGKRDLAKQRRLIRLSVPRGEPGRLVELEESVIKAIRQLFDDLHDIDLSIERAGKGVSELMATRITKVGVDCQKHRRRPVRHPAAYRATGKAGQGGWHQSQPNGALAGFQGPPRGGLDRTYDPPVRLTMNAQAQVLNSDGKVDQRSVVIRTAQQDGLAS